MGQTCGSPADHIWLAQQEQAVPRGFSPNSCAWGQGGSEAGMVAGTCTLHARAWGQLFIRDGPEGTCCALVSHFSESQLGP